MDTTTGEDITRWTTRLSRLDRGQFERLVPLVKEMSIEALRGTGPAQGNNARDADRFVGQWKLAERGYPLAIINMIVVAAGDGKLGGLLLAVRNVWHN